MKVIVVSVCFYLASYVIATPTYSEVFLEEWESFKAEFSKQYNSKTEELLRMKIFAENRLMIVGHNDRFVKGEVSYELEMNQFGDRFPHERNALRMGFEATAMENDPDTASFIPPYNVTVPDTFDWRTKGAVTSVKDQGECGSCYAFSAVGALEGQMFRKTGELVSLSEQNIIDCAKNDSYGCLGGWPKSSLQYVIDNGGLDTEESYPYEAKDGLCRYNPKTRGASAKAIVALPKSGEEALKIAVATVGPISVMISYENEIDFYKGGIMRPASCEESMGHAVLAVGYGTENGQDYWLLKNSFGPKWGLNGYFKFVRNLGSYCHIADYATYPLV